MKPGRQEYKGHPIELRERQDRLELLIDGIPIRYGQLPGGLYFLHEYAFDWSEDLMEVARRFIDYRSKAARLQGERKAGKRGE